MKRNTMVLATVLLSGSLAACTGADEQETSPTHQESNDSSQKDDGQITNDNEQTVDQPADDDQTSSEGEDSDSSSTGDEPTKPETDENDGQSDSDSSSDSSVDDEQKKMAMETLNGLVQDGKEGKVYRLTDDFYVGKTSQTDVYNAIGKPERQDDFDRYNGSMGQASYDLRYNGNGTLVEARYLGTNVERQTNLGGITTEDLLQELGEPDLKRNLEETEQTSYIYHLGKYEIQFIMDEKDIADHVNLLLLQ